jgi:hypothetical protein
MMNVDYDRSFMFVVGGKGILLAAHNTDSWQYPGR